MSPGPQPSDRELVQRAQRGDHEAFNLLVGRHEEKVFHVVFRFCGHHEDACDITQRVFVNAYRKLVAFKGDSAFSTWLYRIAFNQSVSFRREGGHRKSVSIYGKDEDLVVEPEVEQNPGAGLEQEEHRRAVERALLELETADRQIIILKDLEERSYDEIAEVLGIPKGTVRSRLHRARLDLRAKIKSVLGTPSSS